ncbi:hypothetical protein HF521_002880 [Silurus meridionalis]|uniref:Uncharacterized protein n=1 Tax=Silurus meridionalis TaxID=175797 RepID=A0A8T0B5V0_SILME|nr:hypothetical protein HF521_002880 [Silurus meridionalis]
MAKVPLGKVLLRNVIRHTDAHNKIQEESEMWKLRDMQLHTPSPHESKHSWSTRSMHCDRYLKESGGSAHGKSACLSEGEEREARYWTRKLYEFNANDPDRWGHSGFKELYPEEFQSDRESRDAKHKDAQNKRRIRNPLSERKRKRKRSRGPKGRTRSPRAARATAPKVRGNAAKANTAGKRPTNAKRPMRTAAQRTSN